jgi:hypothetical protein
MARTNPRVQNFPNLWQLACAIQKVMERPGVLEVWRNRVLEWSKKQLAHHKLSEWPVSVNGEVPEVEVEREHWLTPGDMIPLPIALTIEGKYAVMAAVYDFATGEHDGIEIIKPKNDSNDWIPFLVLKVSIENMGDIPDVDRDRWFSCLQNVQSDLKLPTPESEAEQSPNLSPGSIRETYEQAESEVPVSSTNTHASHGKGDADAKLRAALTKYHGYSNAAVTKTDPIGGNELGRLAGNVSKGSVTNFWKRHFGEDGIKAYRRACLFDGGSGLRKKLQILNGDYSARKLDHDLAAAYQEGALTAE